MALDYLQRAAELGSERARGQLCALAGLPPNALQGPSAWAQARRAIDLQHWMMPAPKQALSERPRIRAVTSFASAAVCEWLIARGRDLVRPATVFDPQTGLSRQEASRSNSAAEFDIVQADVVVLLIRARIEATLHMPVLAMEPTQVLHYGVGQQFAPHFDYLDPSVVGYARDVAQRGQRIATFLLYLNSAYEGGETDFPRIGLAHRGGQGDALYFANVDDGGQPDPLTLHAGVTPRSGEKWLLSQWIRDRTPSRLTGEGKA